VNLRRQRETPRLSRLALNGLVILLSLYAVAVAAAAPNGVVCKRFVVGRANSSAYPHLRLPARGTAGTPPARLFGESPVDYTMGHTRFRRVRARSPLLGASRSPFATMPDGGHAAFKIVEHQGQRTRSSAGAAPRG
jgi:hypothetical protein